MAVWTARSLNQLGEQIVLAPERYDPRRVMPASLTERTRSVALSSLVTVSRRVVNATSLELETCLILDTSHAREGVAIGPYNLAEGRNLGSAKKVITPGQVIISRLRPYLRQVALVDKGLFMMHANISAVCSTEFYVLSSSNENSIAFLVPYLLCEPVQAILAASQEGGHHPRFSEQTLLNLRVPTSLVETRFQTSHNVETSIKTYREYERNMALFSENAERAYAKPVS